MIRATLADMRALRYCMRGCRAWCRRHGYSWRDVRRHGIDTGELRASRDAMAQQLADQAERRR